MIKAFFYDAEGEDREISLEKKLPQLGEQQLLWVDVIGRDGEELERVGGLFELTSRSVAELRSSRRTVSLNNYGDYFQFDVQSIAHQEESKGTAPKIPRSTRLDFIIGRQWLLTVHENEVAFLTEFREQDRGETLIGNLSSPSLAASLLDWHLTSYLAAIEKLEAFVDALDVRMLAGKSVRDDLLGQLVSGRRYVSSLRRNLAPQRSVFYGLSRPDFSLVATSNAAEHFKSLERRFERALDTVEHGRELTQGSFDLFSTRVAETTNVLIRRLTFLSLMLGAIGAVAGIFGMNFETPYTATGVRGFWFVLGCLGIVVAISAGVSRYRKWI
jgi:Mg2+ and Co2+ transporter CorA